MKVEFLKIYLDSNEVETIYSHYRTDVTRYLYIYRGINNDVDDTVIISSIGS
ncbi:MAG: hypothetical protein V7K72_07410 [Nostoc sp.]|uniref:hypothetical protein n=1 Tax=Nostoc sp. TaxID=1180 RepID=UPI002FF72D17